MLYHENRKYESGFPIHAASYKMKTFLAHWHSEIELVLVTEGSLGMSINSEYQLLKKGDIAICTSGDIHYYNCIDKELTIILIIFRPELIGNVVNLLTNTRFTYPFINHSTLAEIGLHSSILHNIKTYFVNILSEFAEQESYYQVLIKGQLMELIGLFLRHFPHCSTNLRNNMVGGGNKEVIQRAINYIENNYTHDISLQDVSQYLNISPCYFSKVFSKTTGLNYKTYLNSLRIEKAYNLLNSTDTPVIDIAYECGFNSIRTFNRVFKTIKGITPSNLR